MRIIAGKYKGLTLKAPKGMETRPTSSRLRASVFNILQSEIEGVRFLDLYAGSGAMGLEALSRGAAHASFVDESRDAARAIRENIEKMGVQEQTTLLCGDCLAQLPRLAQLGKPYSIIYADPPYQKGLGKLTLEALDGTDLLAPGGLFFMEEAKGFELPPLKRLRFVKERAMGRTVLYQFEKL